MTAQQILDWGFYGGLFVLGACLGSFLYVIACRLPALLEHGWRAQCRQMLGDACHLPVTAVPPGLVFPFSFCPGCRTRLKFQHKLPIIGYHLTRMRCAQCQMKIPLIYPIGEWIAALGCVALGVMLGPGWLLAAAIVLFSALFTLTLIDLETQLLPDSITLPLLWAGLLFNTGSGFTPTESAIYGAALGYVGPWFIASLNERLTGRQGMGPGDFKLLAAVGAWLGWQDLILVMLLAAMGGCLAGILMAYRRGVPLRDLPLPFGPWIAIATLCTVLFGEMLITAYLNEII